MDHEEEAPRPSRVTATDAWDLDVVLTSGRVARVRSIQPTDDAALRDLHSRLSPETRLMRFFTPMPTLPDNMVHRFVNVDHHDRVALAMEVDDQFIAVGRYDRRGEGSDEAEVAFVVDDRFQGEGVGSLLLEHLAAIALEHDITKFVAETLASNDAMLRVFTGAGFDVHRALSGGIFDISFPIAPTDQSEEIRERRDHLATVRSVQRLLRPSTIAIVGDTASELADDVAGHGTPFGGRLLPHGTLEDGVDLVVVDVPPDELGDVLTQCAAHDAGVAVVLSDPPGQNDMRRLTRFARGHGMRILGPRSLGVANTDPDVGLHFFSGNLVPPNESRLVLSQGTVGVFTHSPELTRSVLLAITDRKLGISSAVSAGDKSDISGNDLLEYWEDDDATDVVVLGVESFGNPRRFARLAERLARRKPVIILGPDTPETAALCRRTGVVHAPDVATMAQTASQFALHPEWFQPPGTNDIVLPDMDAEALGTAAEVLASRDAGELSVEDATLVLRAVGLDGWAGPVAGTSIIGRQDARYGPLVELWRPGAERSVALAPMTAADLDGLAHSSPPLADALVRVSAAVAELPDLADVEVQLTRFDTPGRCVVRAAPNPNGVNQIVRYLT